MDWVGWRLSLRSPGIPPDSGFADSAATQPPPARFKMI